MPVNEGRPWRRVPLTDANFEDTGRAFNAAVWGRIDRRLADAVARELQRRHPSVVVSVREGDANLLRQRQPAALHDDTDTDGT